MAFYFKIKILFLVFFFLSFKVESQEENTYWEASYGVGSIIEHSELIEYLYTSYPKVYNLGWHKLAKRDSLSWKARYNYPDQGIVFEYQRLNNENVGDAWALNYTTTFYLRERNADNQFRLQLGFGGAYNTNPIDFDHDVSNIVMSTRILYSQYFRLAYSYPYLFGNIGIDAGLALTHFSNAAVKKPNLGLNTVLLTLALRYNNHKTNPEYPVLYHKPELDTEYKRTQFSLSAGIGLHEAMPNQGSKPVYNLSVYLSKRLNYGNGIRFGMDLFNSESLKEYALYQNISDVENPNQELKDYKQIGLFSGHEMFFNSISFTSKIGYYVYKPLKVNRPIYAVISFKKYFNHRKSAISTDLKVHNFRADHFSINYHHQIF